LGPIVDVYIVSKLANFWGVVNYGVILSRCSTSSDAIRVAVQTAARAAKRIGRAQVLVEDADGERRVVWDSTRDGFATG
jgi:hypothetical protein